MAMTPEAVVALVNDSLYPRWFAEREHLDRIDRWARWDHDRPHSPSRTPTVEYRELMERSQAPWGDLIVGSVAQTLYVEGYRRPDAPEESNGWDIWQANGMDARQVANNRASLTYGLSYGTVVPGVTLTGVPMPVMRCHSPREMLAVYEDPAVDLWPVYALRVRPLRKGTLELTVYDATSIYTLTMPRQGGRTEWVRTEDHPAGVCPVVRFANRFDLEGRSTGEIEPFIPLLGRIDQTSFDRLVVQRFGAWVVRTIAGLDVAESADANEISVDRFKMLLQVGDMLTAENPETKFGSLPATPLDGFIKAKDADLHDLAAVSQTPAFELLGQMANLSAEALAAAKSSQTAKSDERKHVLGEAYEQFIRLACHVSGDREGAEDYRAQVRWADTSIRSLAQAVDAYGKMATMLGFPKQLLWDKVPGFTQLDVEEAAKIYGAEGDRLEQLLSKYDADAQPTVV